MSIKMINNKNKKVQQNFSNHSAQGTDNAVWYFSKLLHSLIEHIENWSHCNNSISKIIITCIITLHASECDRFCFQINSKIIIVKRYESSSELEKTLFILIYYIIYSLLRMIGLQFNVNSSRGCMWLISYNNFHVCGTLHILIIIDYIDSYAFIYKYIHIICLYVYKYLKCTCFIFVRIYKYYKDTYSIRDDTRHIHYQLKNKQTRNKLR